MGRGKQQVPKKARTPSLITLLLAGGTPLLVLGLLCAAGVTLGSPRRFVYPYSMIPELRFMSACKALVLLVPLGWGLYAVASDRSRRRWLGLCTFGASYSGLVAWTCVGNPVGMPEHQFNMISPSQDGAFLREAQGIESLPVYLHRFPQLLNRTKEEIFGIRVLSNTPGTTVLAYGVQSLHEHAPGLFHWIQRAVVRDERRVDDPTEQFAEGACLVVLFTVMWGVAIVLGYALARLWFRPAPALAIAVLCVFNPTSVSFSPGKDPAQLLTTLFMLYCWFRAYLRQSWRWAGLAGVSFVGAAMVGLIHIWVAVIALCATIWNVGWSWRGQWVLVQRYVGPAVGGASVVSLLAYVLWGWNIPVTAFATAARYTTLQEAVLTSPFYYNLLGGAIFLLFLGPGFWMLVVLALASRRSNTRSDLGGKILAWAIAVMLYTYFFAQNAEVPRLWVVFVPLLVCGLGLMSLQEWDGSRESKRVLVTMVLLHCFGTLVHWSLMDVRGTEARILTGRYFGS